MPVNTKAPKLHLTKTKINNNNEKQLKRVIIAAGWCGSSIGLYTSCRLHDTFVAILNRRNAVLCDTLGSEGCLHDCN